MKKLKRKPKVDLYIITEESVLTFRIFYMKQVLGRDDTYK